MDATKRGIILMIKSTITGEALPLPDGFDIQEAAAILKKRGLVTLCYNGAVNCGIDPELPVMLQLQDQYMLDYLRNECQLRQLERLFAAFEENGIDYMPLKGTLMKFRYPSPEMRPMCDADILIRNENYPQIQPIMEQLGFQDAGESDHEHNWRHDDLMVELHKHLIPSYNQDYYRYYGIGWEKAVNSAGHRWSMTTVDAFIYDFTHFCNHYRKAGVACRMIVDLWLYQRKFPDMDTAYIRGELAKMELHTFYDHILHLIDVWFRDEAWDERTEFITDYIFSGGVSVAVANQAKAAQQAGNTALGSKKVWLSKAFPSKDNISWNYPQLKHLPLPIAWVARWYLLLTVRRENLEHQKDKLRAVSPESVEAHLDGLSYVGLKFSD